MFRCDCDAFESSFVCFDCIARSIERALFGNFLYLLKFEDDDDDDDDEERLRDFESFRGERFASDLQTLSKWLSFPHLLQVLPLAGHTFSCGYS